MYYEYFLDEEKVWITCRVLEVDGITGNYLIEYNLGQDLFKKWVPYGKIAYRLLEGISQ